MGKATMAEIHEVSNSTTKPAVHGEGHKFEGVRGTSHDTHGGVVGINDWAPKDAGSGGNGGWFESSQGEGVRGWAKSPFHGGVVGVNTAKGIGVFGTSDGEGVHGETTSNEFVAGVTGLAVNQDGVGPGVLGQSNGSGAGVVGKAIRDAGVIGFHGDPRLQETTVANDGSRAGVFGASDVGAGVLGYSRDPNSPAVFAFGGFKAISLGKPLAALFEGNVQVDGDIFLPGADCAEHFDLAQGELCDAGTVMVIEDSGTLKPCDRAYDKKAAGVVSGAGKFKPGIILHKQESTKNRLPIALVGKVYCKVDAQFASIEVGDMLTTSPTAGYAMKADDPYKAFGAVIGKALLAMSGGQGLIPILVALQ